MTAAAQAKLLRADAYRKLAEAEEIEAAEMTGEAPANLARPAPPSRPRRRRRAHGALAVRAGDRRAAPRRDCDRRRRGRVVTADERELPADLRRCRRCRQLHTAFAVVADALDEHRRRKPVEPALSGWRTDEELSRAVVAWREWNAQHERLDRRLHVEIERHCAHVELAHPLATA